MKPWGEPETVEKDGSLNQFPPNNSLGNQVFNLVVTILALIGFVTLIGVLHGHSLTGKWSIC